MVCQFDEFGVCAFDGSNLCGAEFGEIRLLALAFYKHLSHHISKDVHERRM